MERTTKIQSIIQHEDFFYEHVEAFEIMEMKLTTTTMTTVKRTATLTAMFNGSCDGGSDQNNADIEYLKIDEHM